MNKKKLLSEKKLVQLFKILFHSFSKIILIFNCFACSIFFFVGFASPTTKKSSFFEIDLELFHHDFPQSL